MYMYLCMCMYMYIYGLYMYIALSRITYHRELGCDVAQLKGTCDIECSLCGGVWDVRRIRGWGFNEGRGLGSLWRRLGWYI